MTDVCPTFPISICAIPPATLDDKDTYYKRTRPMMEAEINIDSALEYDDGRKRLIDEEGEAKSEGEGSRSDGGKYNFDVSVAIAETDEIDAEFCNAVEEIEGKKSFPCAKVTKYINPKVA